MILTIVVGVVGLVAGFGAGRIKNAARLAAIQAEVGKVESYVSTEARSLASAIESHL